ncbi:hypothetical protein ACJX0J_042381, partial [Zea mays]
IYDLHWESCNGCCTQKFDSHTRSQLFTKMECFSDLGVNVHLVEVYAGLLSFDSSVQIFRICWPDNVALPRVFASGHVDLLVHLLQECMAIRFTDVNSALSVSWAPKPESSIAKLQNSKQCLRYCWYAQPKYMTCWIELLDLPCELNTHKKYIYGRARALHVPWHRPLPQ